MRTKVKFFFNQPLWTLTEIPDLRDPDPERYAVLAVLPHYMAHVFNRLIEQGLPRGSPAIIIGNAAEAELKSRPVVLEKEPNWVTHVPRMQKTLVIPDKNGVTPPENARSDKFIAMNIIVVALYLAFV